MGCVVADEDGEASRGSYGFCARDDHGVGAPGVRSGPTSLSPLLLPSVLRPSFLFAPLLGS